MYPARVALQGHIGGQRSGGGACGGGGGAASGSGASQPHRSSVKVQVKPFTKESLDRLESKTIQLVRDYGFQPRRKLSVEDGSVLPNKFEPFPSRLYGRPLEEIDNFIYDETFCVVSKRFRKNYIHRFTATPAFFVFSPWNPIRRSCIYLSTNPWFDYFVMATILLNCVFLAMTEPMEQAEYIFLAIYTAEMIIKSVAKGFILKKYTYLRNPWNWLDFVVITSGYATIGMEVGNLAGLRTFRVLRALKTVSIMPGLKTIINALLHSFKQLAEVMTLTIFCLMVFALFALQVYMGELRNKCVRKPTASDEMVAALEAAVARPGPSPGSADNATAWREWISSEKNWLLNANGDPILCGNVTGARHCPPDYVCLRIGPNPNHGFTNFDNFLWSMLTTFQLITLDYWENVYNMVLSSCGPISVSFFTVVVFFGSFYLINLMLAVVALSYEEEAEITQEERRKDLTDHRDDSTFSFDPTRIPVKALEKNQKKKIDSRKGVLLASYSRKKSRRRKKRSANSSATTGGENGNGDRSKTASRSATPSPRHSTVSQRNELAFQAAQEGQRRLLKQQLKQLQNSGQPPLSEAEHGSEPASGTAGRRGPKGVSPPTAPHSHLQPDMLLPPNAHGGGGGAGVGGGGPNVRLGLGGRQSSNNSEANNRESSLDDSGVVDDHEEADGTSEDVAPASQRPDLGQPVTGSATVPKTLATVEVPPGATTSLRHKDRHRDRHKEIRVLKCNGVSPAAKRELYGSTGLPTDYLSQVVVLENVEDRNCAGCTRCCLDYGGWLHFQHGLHKVVRDPIFELLITLCIVTNTAFLATEHHGMSDTIRQALDVGNKVFTSIFTLECLLKLLALSKDFFSCGWNIFDMLIVSASLLDLSFELVGGLSVLRGLRLLRVLKLAQSWTTMKVLLSIIISTIGALGNLTFVLVIVIYIFAVIGMQLFSKDYTQEKFDPDPIPRWNFSDFFHSFMMIFRILCGEWIEPLWDCMRAERQEGYGTCFLIFLPALVMGNFMVLNLFLALLLNSFNSEELKSKKEEVGEDSKLARSFERIRSLVRKKRTRRRSQSRTRSGRVRENSDNEQNMKLEEMVRQVMREHAAGCENANHPVRETAFDMIDGQNSPPAVPACTGITISTPTDDAAGAETEETNMATDDDHAGDIPVGAASPPLPIPVGNDSEDADADALEDAAHLARSQQQLQMQQAEESQQDQRVVGWRCRRSWPRRESQEDGERRFSLTDVLQASNSKDDSAIEGDSAPPTTNTLGSSSGRGAGGSSLRMNEIAGNTVDDSQAPKKPWLTLVSYVDELTVGGRRDSKGRYIDGLGRFPGFGRDCKDRTPQDCFPPNCFQRCKCMDRYNESPWGARWTKVRTAVLSVVDTPVFEWLVLILIFASSVTLCFEDIHLDRNAPLKTVLYWTNLGFCLLFTIEMVLKWVALGFWKYFTSFWTVLDFVIVFVSIFSLLIEENENLKVLRSLRTLRALRPLRAISRWQGMRIVVNALMYAIPSIFNVLLVCLVFWLIFSIMGVQFFGGKFFKCLDADGELLPITIVNDRAECLAKNYSWENSKITFDNVGNAYLALFQVATFEGWMEVMADAVDSRGVDLQPSREASIYAYLYFVIFIVCGSFFTLNLFIGVIIDNFNMLKKKYEGGVLEMFLTESQKHYYTAMKKLGRKKPQKVIKRPMNQFLAMFYDLSNSRRFEVAIFVLIFLNMVTMGIEHYGQPHAVFFILEVSNAFFTTVFGLEALVKMMGLRLHYFTVPWNLFDFLLVLASILGIVMEDIMIDLPVSPTLLRVVRVFRIGRILRLIKAAKGIRKLLFALVVSLPALFNIGALLALVTFIYAIIGMSVFGHVKQQRALDDMVNFETFGRSMQLLFRLMTSAGWNDVLESLMVEPPDCDPDFDRQPNGNCGYPLLAITYFTSFIIISYMIVINMYIAIILENFNQAHQEEEIGIVEDDLEMFYIRWSKFDPHATQFIRFSQLSDFIASLDPPLGIPKPNVVALVSFNLPIARGNKIHCLDILHALVKHVLGHVEETDDFRKLQDQMDIKFKKQFPTRKELEIVSSTRLWKRQDKAARLIQSTFRDYIKRKHDAERDVMDLEDETTQTSSPGASAGWQGRLSAFLHVHRGSRASSRKSSRASDASDLSELGGAWLNLPLLLVAQPGLGPEAAAAAGAGGGGVAITVSQPSPDQPRELDSPTDLFGGHEESLTETVLSLCGIDPVSIMVTQPSPDNATAPVPVPPLPESQSSPVQSPPTSPPSPASPPSTSSSIVTRPAAAVTAEQRRLAFRRTSAASDSAVAAAAAAAARRRSPQPPRQASEVVHVLVHRESEEDRDR